MSCERLVCANCAQPVVEGNCAVCRAARAEVHGHHSFGLPPQVLALLVLLVAVTALLVAHYQY
jgi:hypothetical protein